MKKLFGFMVMSLVAVMPFAVKAETTDPTDTTGTTQGTKILDYKCSSQDADGNITCTVSYNALDIETEVTLTLTEEGGATVTSINQVSGSEWSLAGSPNKVNNVWTIVLTSTAGSTGEHDIFTFTYKASGTEDCKIVLAKDSSKAEVTPNPTPSTPDEPTDNKQTGATLPYIALGAVVLIATGAYLATRNKAKMYKI